MGMGTTTVTTDTTTGVVTITQTPDTVQEHQLSDGNVEGSVLGQSATDLIAFYGETGIVQPLGTVELITSLKALGLIGAGATPLTPTGAFTFTTAVATDGGSLAAGTTNGLTFGTASTQVFKFLDGLTVGLGSTSGLTLGSATTQKLTLGIGTVTVTDGATLAAGTTNGLTFGSASTQVFSFADGLTVGIGSTTGLKIGATSTSKLAFLGAAPIAKRSTLTFSTSLSSQVVSTSSWGFSTSTQQINLNAAVNEIITTLQLYGLHT